MPWSGILAVGGGAALGAWLRWGLGIALNPLFPTVPLGTLAANLIGGLLMGLAMELLTRHAVLAPEAQLLVTTGFLGGLTTFSTFSGGGRHAAPAPGMAVGIAGHRRPRGRFAGPDRRRDHARSADSTAWGAA